MEIFSFGLWLKQQRWALGLTQDELAQRVGCAEVTIRKIEADERRPSLQIAARLADQLRLAPAERATFLRAARAELRADYLPEPQPPATLAAPPATALPIAPTPLIGRDAELAEIQSYLRHEDVRLLTLTGPPGIGKTRLSIAAASEVSKQFPQGVHFIPLAPISDPDLVAQTIARALDVAESGSAPLFDRLRLALQGAHLLLLDNFEQLLAAAPLIADLLAAVPHLKILVTSRAALRVAAEHEFAVAPLALPDLTNLPPPGMLVEYPAIRLFVQRAQAVNGSFRLTKANAAAVAAICARLDGLPLAIELAAARSKLSTPQALLARLDNRLAMLTSGGRDLPARHQTLRSAIEWSYQLLDSAEQRLFAYLGVFVGGWTVEAAEAICDVGLELLDGAAEIEPARQKKPTPRNLLDALTSLVDHSLVTQKTVGDDELRFTMLETIREYALELLAASGAQEVIGERHAAYYCDLAERTRPQLYGAEREVWLERLDREKDNFRAALNWALANQERVGIGLRLASALGRFWRERGYLREGRQWLERVLALAGDPHLSAGQQGKALAQAASLACFHGDFVAARALAEESVAVHRAAGDRRGLALALGWLSWALLEQGEQAPARALAEERVALWRELGEPTHLSWALSHRGWTAQRQGDYATAQAHIEEALALERKLKRPLEIARLLWDLAYIAELQGDEALSHTRHEEGLSVMRAVEDPRDRLEALHSLAFTLYKRGDYDQAAAIFTETIGLARQNQQLLELAWHINHLGDVRRSQGNYEEAEALYNEALAMFREQGHQQAIASMLHNLGYIARRQGDYVKAEALFAECLALFQAIGHIWSMADSLAGLGGVAAVTGRGERAARLMGAAEAVQQVLDASALLLEPANRIEWEHSVAAIRAQLGEADYAAAWAAGRALTLEEAMSDWRLEIGD